MKDNVILVSIDSLRADHCGFIGGNDQNLTPTMDELANDGIAFRTAIAPGPRTPSSIPPIVTGEFHQYRDWESKNSWQQRRQRIGQHLSRHQSIAKTLQNDGYNTAAYTMNPWTARDTNFDAGFDEFDSIYGNNTLDFSDNTVLRMSDKLLTKTGLGDRVSWDNKKEWFSQWPTFIDQIKTILEGLDEPYFLWVFVLDCHQPYFTPEKFRKEVTAPEMYYSVLRYWRKRSSKNALPNHVNSMLRKSYRDTVRSTDAFLKEIVSVTEDDHPSIVIHADHGEAHGEHGTYGHESQLYDVNIHIPLILYNIDQQGTVDEQVSLRKIPTIIEDIALSKMIDPKSYTDELVTSITEYSDQIALRGHGWKYIHSEDGIELYNLEDDPAEQHDCSEDFPNVTETFDNHVEQIQSHLCEQYRITQSVCKSI